MLGGTTLAVYALTRPTKKAMHEPFRKEEKQKPVPVITPRFKSRVTDCLPQGIYCCLQVVVGSFRRIPWPQGLH